MKMQSRWIPTVLLALTMGAPWAHGKELTYHDLATKDLDQMAALVKKKIKASGKEGNLTVLREGVRLVFSRPDSDGMIDKVISPLRHEIEEADSWEDSLEALTDESVAALKNPDELRADVQVTHAVFLINVVAQLKPRLKKHGPSRRIVEKIRDADLELSSKARNERRNRLMKGAKSPSEIAAEALAQAGALEATDAAETSPSTAPETPAQP